MDVEQNTKRIGRPLKIIYTITSILVSLLFIAHIVLPFFGERAEGYRLICAILTLPTVTLAAVLVFVPGIPEWVIESQKEHSFFTWNGKSYVNVMRIIYCIVLIMIASAATRYLLTR